MKEPRYYRARIKAIETKGSSIEINENERFLRNGFIPNEIKEQFEKKVNRFTKEVSNEPLSFAEITSFSTWFAMHPEKMAGIEAKSTSKAFPVKLKGNRTDIDKMIKQALQSSNKSKSEKEAEALALALQLELELMELDSLNGVVSDFNKAIKQFLNRKFTGQFIRLGKPKNKLLKNGISNKEIIIRTDILRKKINQHILNYQHLRNLPNRLNNPVFIFKPKKNVKAYNVFINNINHEGLLMCSIYDLNTKVNTIEILEIKSIHGRRCSQLENWISQDLLIYSQSVDKIKKLFSDSGFNCPKSEQFFKILSAKIK